MNETPPNPDHPIPGWWNTLLLVAILGGVCYAAFYHLSPAALSPRDKRSVARHDHMQRMYSTIAAIPLSDEKLLALMNEPRWRETGAGIYALRCAPCHGLRGEGFIGPDMTDDHYKTVRTLTDLVGVITDGSGGGTMPPQRQILHPSEITVVAAFVAGLRGRNLEGPRPPEGEVIAPWPTLVDPPP